MALPPLMLGGVPIVLHAGAPEESIEPIGGNSLLRMSGGAAVKQQHWSRSVGSIAGAGWMPPGLTGLDYTGPLELRSTKVQNQAGAGPTFNLDGTPRPDYAPWGQALVGGEWQRVPSSYEPGEGGGPGVLTIPPVPGATLYMASWLPVFSVFGNKPSESQSRGNNTHNWTFNWEEA